MHPLPAPPCGRTDHRTPGRYLLWLATGHRRALLLTIGYGVACTLSQALIPVAVGSAVDDGLIARDSSALLWWAAAILGLGVVQATTSILQDRSSLSVSLGAAYRTMRVVTAQAARLGASLTGGVARGEAVTVGVSDATQLGRTLATTAQACGAVAAVAAVSVIMLRVSWQLALTVLVGVPLMLWAVSLLVKPLHRRQQRLREQQSALTSLAVDVADGLRTLRGIGGEAVYADRYRRASQEMRDIAVQLARVEADLTAARELLPGLLMTVIVWAGATFVVSGRISAGDLVVFYAYAVFLTTPLRRLIAALDQTTRGFVAARHVIALLSLRSAADGTRESAPGAGAVALHDAETGLRVPSGRYTAVVCGVPGAADSLAERLGGHHDATVAWNGVPLGDLPRDTVRRAILVTRNDDLLFSGSLSSMLDPARRHGPDEGPLLQALEAASARDVVDALPDGLRTVIIGGGKELSGGQRQRLKLARALLADPEVLVLVEPTSAVDAHTEKVVARRLAAYREGRTTVILTHSPPLLHQADHVVLLDGTRAPLEGVHSELLQDVRYHRVVAREDREDAETV